MITEDFVSFEIAKLLKEKGFDELCKCVYSPKGVFHKSNRTNIYDYYDNALLDEVGNADYFLAPTQAQVTKWLREVHNIFIDIAFRFSRNADNDINFSYYAEKYENYYGYGDGEFNSYEEAAEAAIKYCLENLI